MKKKKRSVYHDKKKIDDVNNLASGRRRERVDRRVSPWRRRWPKKERGGRALPIGLGTAGRPYCWVTVSFTTTVSPLGNTVLWQVTKVRCLARIIDRLLSATSARSSAASSSLWNLRTRDRLVEDTDSCGRRRGRTRRRERERQVCLAS